MQKLRKHLVLIIGVITAFIVGVAAGTSTTTTEGQPQAQPEPAATVTATATVTPPERTVTQQTTVTPQECLDALDRAEEGFQYASEVITVMADGVQASVRRDLDALNEANEKMEQLSPLSKGIRSAYDESATKCRELT